MIFELGYFCGKLGRKRVVALQKGDIEIPPDYNGIVYVEMDENGTWERNVAKELQEAGFQINMNSL